MVFKNLGKLGIVGIKRVENFDRSSKTSSNDSYKQNVHFFITLFESFEYFLNLLVKYK